MGATLGAAGIGWVLGWWVIGTARGWRRARWLPILLTLGILIAPVTVTARFAGGAVVYALAMLAGAVVHRIFLADLQRQRRTNDKED